ncbi:GAF domain-containing protein [Tumidithrix elongata RA019]|uniref:Circadian input-output histidine kinase CikA n=1 Tax=Tumidithrix elongata BACA0141 TaxID=2716417 RepID=A0AAW9PYM5_9CYAN|nr:GAF domain-containing protein [Tumidithrix elongata RA019]
MIPAQEPANEILRLEALQQCRILDTPPEQAFDDITSLAAHLCQTPIALISLLDANRQWFKSRVGLDVTETPKCLGFCAHAILQQDVMIVPNALLDKRFADNPLVTGSPYIRFYAGAPLITSEGYALGSLCVIDRVPRQLSSDQIAALKMLARQVVHLLELRHNLADLDRVVLQRQAPSKKSWFLSKVGIGMAIAASIFMGMGFISYQSLTNLVKTSEVFLEKRQNSGRFDRISDRLHELDVQQYRYFLSGQEKDLENYYLRVDEIRHNIQDLQKLPISERQQEVLSQLSQIVEKQAIEIQSLISLVQNRQLETARQRFLTFRNSALLNEVRQNLDQLANEESIVIDNWSKEIELASVRSSEKFFSGALINLVIFGIIFYITYQEISKRRKLEDSLEQERDFIMTILDTTDALVVVLNPKGRIVRFNRKCEQISGFTFEEVRDKYFWSIFLIPEETKAVKEVFADLVKNELPSTSENYWLNREGERRLIAWSNTQLRNRESVVEYVIVTGIDITERKQAEENVRQQNWRSLLLSTITLRIRQSLNISEILNTTVTEVRQFFKTDRALIFQFDHNWEGKVVVESLDPKWRSCVGRYISDSCFREGLWREYARGRKQMIDDITTANLSPCYQAVLEQLQVKANLVVPILENNHLWGLLIMHHCSEPRHWKSFEIDFLSELANQVGIALYQARLLEQETLQKKLLTEQNIELEEARNEAEKATKLKSAFLATMSHEIRTPMNAVLGMTSLLMNTKLTAEQQEFAETIQLSGENLLTLINEILDISKLEAKEMNLESIDFNLSNCVEEVIGLLAFSAQAKGLEIASLIYAEVPLQLKGDEGRIRQILTNLVSNAIKFTSEGYVSVTVALQSETADSAIIEFSVTDTGIGIPTSAQHRLFTPFTQVDTSTTRKFGGTGLGLAICKQFVELMGGTIAVDSCEAEGANFKFAIPLAKQSNVQERAISPQEVSPNSLKNKRTLIVENRQITYRVLHYQLSEWQMHVDRVEASDAVIPAMYEAIAEGQPYDIAILDRQMLGSNAEILGQKIKSDPNLKYVKLLLMTSLQDRDNRQQVQEAGFSNYLIAPIKQSKLYDRLLETMSSAKDISEIEPQKSAASASTVRRSPLKILLAEDNPINQKVAVNLLKISGYHADVAVNGMEVLKALAQTKYDLVLMDCQMPELDGFATTRKIRALDSPDCDIVIVAMTANARQEDRESCLECGMNDYLSKPIHKAVLAEKMQYWEQIILGDSLLPSLE